MELDAAQRRNLCEMTLLLRTRCLPLIGQALASAGFGFSTAEEGDMAALIYFFFDSAVAGPFQVTCHTSDKADALVHAVPAPLCGGRRDPRRRRIRRRCPAFTRNSPPLPPLLPLIPLASLLRPYPLPTTQPRWPQEDILRMRDLVRYKPTKAGYITALPREVARVKRAPHEMK